MFNLKMMCLYFIVLSGLLKAIESASLPILEIRSISEVDLAEEISEEDDRPLIPAQVRENAPPPLCAVRCASPPSGPVCAFDARGTARTFATLCELEAVSCKESTYYAITNLGEC